MGRYASRLKYPASKPHEPAKIMSERERPVAWGTTGLPCEARRGVGESKPRVCGKWLRYAVGEPLADFRGTWVVECGGPARSAANQEIKAFQI